MRRLLVSWFGISAVCLTAAAQRPVGPAIYREFDLVTRLRVVCSNEHFGRIDDLVVAVPSGRITAAVVTFAFDGGSRRLTVPYSELTYDATANWMSLAECLEGEHAHDEFDPSKIQLHRLPDAAGVKGAVLASSLKQHVVALRDGVASVQGLELDLRSGRVGFLDVAVGRERAGDRDLHPAPWSVFAWRAQAKEPAKVQLAVSLPHKKAFLASTPNLIEIIIPDPLRRARVYAAFGVAAPHGERDN